MGYNKVKLHSGQVCDYLYIQKDNTGIEDFKYVNSEPDKWNKNTLLFAKFNGNAIAGNVDLLDNISGFEIRRRKVSETHTDYIGKVTEKGINYIIDYLACNNTDYIYYLYPISTSSTGQVITLSPSVENAKGKWNYWSLFVVDETDEDNVFYLDKMFKFELNLQVGDMTNNADIKVTNNFTKYPTVQFGTSNYWSGSLSSLCGFISCYDHEYSQTPNMINELKELTSDTRRKFLKDMDGNVWEVQVTGAINISTNNETLEKLKTVQILWTEVGSVDGLSVINNPNKLSVDWILTETGEAVPYVDYIWDEQYIWNNDYRWTSNNNILLTKQNNLGKSINIG